eukprot:GHUV01010611.1.p1 GENE.GHUV01010611.1~~GHUV01010611.1.p1  ORF type:complete len:501 (+),score=62.70 GHUV01010611.1:268-1770(+)
MNETKNRTKRRRSASPSDRVKTATEVYQVLGAKCAGEFVWESDNQTMTATDSMTPGDYIYKRPVVLVPQGGAAGALAGPPYRALDILRTSYPHWEVEACSSSTRGRSYQEMRMEPWELRDADVTEIKRYLQRMLGNLRVPIDPTQGLLQLEPLKSELECNCKFARFYGEPVAYILAQLLGESISFHVSPPTFPATGEPDFIIYHKRIVELLRGEGKTPTVLKSAATMFPIGREDAKLESCARQECDYMRKKDRRYGWLTYLNGTFFVKRTPEDPHLYKFTRALPSRSVDITVLEMLAYITLKQLEENEWPALPADQPAVAVEHGLVLPHGQGEPTTNNSSSTGRITRSQSAAVQQQGPGVASISGALHSHADWALQFNDKRLGAGQCGIVVEGRYYNEPSAIKAIDLSKRHRMVELMNEVNTYERLSPLQGQCIPVLKGYGLWDSGNTMFLAMSKVEGEHPNSSTCGAREVAEKVRAIWKDRLHHRRCLHTRDRFLQCCA